MVRHGIELDSDALKAFCRKWKIKELAVFGSYLNDTFRPDSDVDFLAEFEADEEWDLIDELRMRDELERIVGRRVDLMCRQALETGGNALFQREVLNTAKRIYAS
jgi:predicted nucleotidyltransferase